MSAVFQFAQHVAEAINGFLSSHAGMAVILASAFIATMRETLPAPFNRVEIFVWTYAWIHDALKAFVNMRQPVIPQTESRTIAVTETHTESVRTEPEKKV